METLTIGPLRTHILRGEGPLTIVLCHGFGAPGDDLVTLATAIDAPPGTTFVFPEAHHALADFVSMPFPGMGDARAWWMIDMERMQHAIMTGRMRDLPNEIPEGLAEARDALNAMLDALAPKGELILGGFSQGAMLALDVTLRGERAIDGLVLFSGTLLAEREWVPLMKSLGLRSRRGQDQRRSCLRVFQSHGTEDPILPYALAERLRDELVDSALDVTFESFDGPHAIPPSVLRSLSRWLAA
jgi:phospholipase/carboxylesterase